jgi:hypothetical protein
MYFPYFFSYIVITRQTDLLQKESPDRRNKLTDNILVLHYNTLSVSNRFILHFLLLERQNLMQIHNFSIAFLEIVPILIFLLFNSFSLLKLKIVY